jgi:excisionase family DNA binding protein
MTSDWYSTTDVARLLGRSDRYVRDRVKRGELPAQEGGGGERKSYKISREALLGYLMANERRNTQEVEKIVEGVDIKYLQDLEAVIGRELISRVQGRVEILPKCRRALQAVMDIERRNYPDELYPATPERLQDVYMRCYNNPHHFAATALNRSGVAEGYFAVGLTTYEYYEGVVQGQIHEDVQPPWQEGKPAIIYLNSLVLEDPVWAHFLFKEVGRQLREFFRRQRIVVNVGFAIAANRSSELLLEKYGFGRTPALFEGRYAVMYSGDLAATRVGYYLR